MMTGTRAGQRSRRVRIRCHGRKKRASMGADSGHPAKRFSLLLLVLGIVSVAACGTNNEASPAATSGSSQPPTSATIVTPTSDTLSGGEVARLFHYDRRRSLAITRLGPGSRMASPSTRSPTPAPRAERCRHSWSSPKGRGRSRA